MTAKLQPLDHLQAEAETQDQPVTVRLEAAGGGVDLTVLPYEEWPTTAYKLLKGSDFEDWAEQALADDSYEKWQQAKPNNRQALAFVEAWGEAVGQSSGESRASRRSSRSTARR